MEIRFESVKNKALKYFLMIRAFKNLQKCNQYHDDQKWTWKDDTKRNKRIVKVLKFTKNSLNLRKF